MGISNGSQVRSVELRTSFAVVSASAENAGNQSILYSDVPGCSAQLRAHTIYALDGYIAYDTTTNPTILLVGPTQCTGHWGLFSLAGTVSTNAGNATAYRSGDITHAGEGDSLRQVPGGLSGTPIMTPLHGVIATNRYGGVAQLRFAQLTATAVQTQIRAGSWLRATRIGPNA